MVNLSIIIPAFNEELNIASCLKRTQAANPAAQIIVVDGGSDNTINIVKELIKEFPLIEYINNKPDKGKGHAIQVGIHASKGRYIAQLDADLQFHPEEICGLLKPLESNVADFVMGSRFLPDSSRLQGSTPAHRTMGNVIISKFASVLFKHKMTDVLAGIKVWNSEVTKSFILESNSYSYEVELPIKALYHKWRVIELPVTTAPRLQGESSVRVFKVGARVIFDIFCWKIRSIMRVL